MDGMRTGDVLDSMLRTEPTRASDDGQSLSPDGLAEQARVSARWVNRGVGMTSAGMVLIRWVQAGSMTRRHAQNALAAMPPAAEEVGQ